MFTGWFNNLPTSFAHPWLALLFLLTWHVMRGWSKLQPRIRFPSIGMHSQGVRGRIFSDPSSLLIAVTWAFLVLIVMGPQLPAPKEVQSRDYIAVQTIIDVSSSMSEEINDKSLVELGKGEADKAKIKKVRKIDAAKAGTRAFWAGRPRDLKGLYLFGNDFYPVAVLTDEDDLLLDELEAVGQTLNDGTNFEGPAGNDTRVGCFQGIVDQFRDMKRLLGKHGIELPKTLVAAVVTDGESSISEARFKQLRKAFADLDIYLYVLGVGDSWTKKPPSDQTKDIRHFVEAVNNDALDRWKADGKSPSDFKPHAVVFPIADAQAMRDAFDTMNQLHRTVVHIERDQGMRDEFRVFAWGALISFTLSLAAAFTVGRRV